MRTDEVGSREEEKQDYYEEQQQQQQLTQREAHGDAKIEIHADGGGGEEIATVLLGFRNCSVRISRVELAATHEREKRRSRRNWRSSLRL